MKLIDQVKFVVGFPPCDINTAQDNSTYLKGDYVHMKYYDHLTIVLLAGASAGGTGSVNVYQATDAAGGSAKTVGVDYRYLCTATNAASDTWVKTTVTSDTWDHPATANLYNVIEVDSTQLDIEGGFEWVAINIDSAGGTTYGAALYILSGPRYISAETAPTALT